MDRSADQQLGARYGAALSGSNDLSPQLRQAMLLDLLGADRSLWPALRQLIEQPGFDTLRREASSAIRLAGREAWLQELATWCNQESLERAGAFLDGLLYLSHNPSGQQSSDGAQQQRSKDDAQSPGPSGAAPQQAQAEASAQAAEQQAEVRRLSEQGVAASNRGEHQRAIALFSEALRRDGGDALLYMQRASVQALLGQTEAAILDFDAVLRLQPSNLEALAQRGQAKAALGQFNAASQDWQQASQQGHRQAGLWLKRQREKEQAERNRDERSKQDGSGGQQSNQQSGQQPDQQPRSEPASTSQQHNQQTAAQQSRQCYQQGLASKNRGEHQQAIEHFTQAIQHDGTHSEAYLERAMLHARAGHLPLALKDVSAVMRLEPSNLEARVFRGNIHERLKDKSSARRDWEVAAANGHQEARRWVANDCLQRAKDEATKGNHRHAISLASRAIALGGARSEDFLLRGTCRQRLQEHTEAYDDFSQALALDPDHCDALIRRGQTLAALKREEEARSDWERARALGRTDAPNLQHRTSGETKSFIAFALGLAMAILLAVSFMAGWPMAAKIMLASVASALFRWSAE